MSKANKQAHLRWKWRSSKNRSAPKEGKNGTYGYVYIVRLTDEIFKIGKSGNFQNRLSNLMASNPNIQVVVFRRVKNMNEAEKNLHRMFDKKRIEREWFKLSDGDIDRATRFMDSQTPPMYPERIPNDHP